MKDSTSTPIHYLLLAVLPAILCASQGCSTVAYTPEPAEVAATMSFVQARRAALEVFGQKSWIWSRGQAYGISHDEHLRLRVLPDRLEILRADGTRLKALPYQELDLVSAGALLGDHYVSEKITWRGPHVTDAKFHCFGFSAEEARRGAGALNALIQQARQGNRSAEAAEFERFRLQAAAWRDLSVKPPHPVDVARRRVLAENAVREKRYDEALEHYLAALATTPLWPEGHYNAALLYAEIEAYRHAADHMRRYLELEPGLSEVAAAREKLIVWEDKAK